MIAPTSAPAPAVPHLTVRGREIPIVLPSRRDPRFKLSAVIMTLHVLGQTLLDFKVSVAQIVVTIAFCGLVEAVITYRGAKVLVWPASGILTGSSVAFILRASGTRHGDWWSLNGIEFFLLAAVLSLLAKHLVRPTGKHLFNPSNVGIVGTLLLIGPNHVFVQYLWWGPHQVGVAVAYAVILAGAIWILRAVRMIPMAVSFLVTFAAITGVYALAGRTFIAIWHEGPVGGLEYWVNLALSPEVLVFVFFMISDPQTAPKQPLGRIVYGASVAALAGALIGFQTTEFGIKVAILSSLVVVCALVPFLEAWARRRASVPAAPAAAVLPAASAGAVLSAVPAGDGPVPAAAPSGDGVAGPPVPPPAPRRARGWARGWARAVRRPAVAAALVIAVAAPIDTLALAGNEQVVLIERGVVGKANAQ